MWIRTLRFPLRLISAGFGSICPTVQPTRPRRQLQEELLHLQMLQLPGEHLQEETSVSAVRGKKVGLDFNQLNIHTDVFTLVYHHVNIQATHVNRFKACSADRNVVVQSEQRSSYS